MAKLVSGKKYELTLKKGTKEARPERAEGDYSERTIKGEVREFEQVERVYDEDGIAVDKKVEKHWEVLMDDPNYPAVGFLLDDVVDAKPV